MQQADSFFEEIKKKEEILYNQNKELEQKRYDLKLKMVFLNILKRNNHSFLFSNLNWIR